MECSFTDIRVITHASGSCGSKVHISICLCVSVSPHDISKTDAGRITKLDVEMFHNESWKPIYFGLKRSRSQVTKTLPAWVFALLLVLASSNLSVDVLLSCRLIKLVMQKTLLLLRQSVQTSVITKSCLVSVIL